MEAPEALDSQRDRFFRYLREGRLEEVRLMLAETPALVSQRKDGATPLHWAAWENHLEIAKLLVAVGSDLDAVDERHGMLPIAWANEHGHMGMVRTLAAVGAVPLPLAAGCGLIDHVRSALEADAAAVNESYGYGTALQYAALWGQTEVVDLLLQAGADATVRDEHGRTPRQVALHQTSSKARATMLAIDLRKDEIQRGCAEVVARLERIDR